MEKKLSIIIVNYNSSKYLKECLGTFAPKIVGYDYEVIIVDGGSDKSDFEKVKLILKGSGIKLIRCKDNVGFGKANNLGLKEAKGKYILFLNPDTLAGEIDFKQILEWMEENPDIGAMSCKLKNLDGSTQGNGGFFPNLFRVFTWTFFIDDIPFLDKVIKSFHPHHPKFFPNNKFYDSIREVDWITGAFFFARNDAIDVGFDENIFMYGEDVDLSRKVKNRGYKIYYNPKWNIYHLGGGSSNTEFPIITEFESLKYYYKKNMPKYQMPILVFLLRSGIFFRRIIYSLTGSKELAKAYAKTHLII